MLRFYRDAHDCRQLAENIENGSLVLHKCLIVLPQELGDLWSCWPEAGPGLPRELWPIGTRRIKVREAVELLERIQGEVERRSLETIGIKRALLLNGQLEPRVTLWPLELQKGASSYEYGVIDGNHTAIALHNLCSSGQLNFGELTVYFAVPQTQNVPRDNIIR